MESREELLLDESRQPEAVCVDRREQEPALSSHQKFRKASGLAGRIAGVLSEVSTAKFHNIMAVLEALLQHWMNDEEVHLTREEYPLAPPRENWQCHG